jgi:hypothetical protein
MTTDQLNKFVSALAEDHAKRSLSFQDYGDSFIKGYSFIKGAAAVEQAIRLDERAKVLREAYGALDDYYYNSLWRFPEQIEIAEAELAALLEGK